MSFLSAEVLIVCRDIVVHHYPVIDLTDVSQAVQEWILSCKSIALTPLCQVLVLIICRSQRLAIRPLGSISSSSSWTLACELKIDCVLKII